MFCIHCGKQINDASAFCPYCGASRPLHPTNASNSKSDAQVPPSTTVGQIPITQETFAIPQKTTLIGVSATDDTYQRASADGTQNDQPDSLAGLDVLAYDAHWRDSAPSSSTPLNQTGYAPPTPSQAQTSPQQPPAPAVSHPPIPPKKRNRRKSLIAAIIGGAVAAAAIVVGIFWLQHNAAEEALRQTHPLTLKIVAADYSDQCTKFPVLATGVDLDGNNVEETFFVGADGKGVALLKGEYTLTFPASPLTPDGVLYQPPSAEVRLVISRDLEAGQSIDNADLGELVYQRSTALDETDEMIDAAVSWARRDPSQSDAIDALEQAARKAHSNAVAEEAERERQRREAEAQAEAERAAEAERQRKAESATTNPSTVDFINADATLKGILAAETPRSEMQAYYRDRGWTVPAVVYVLYFERPTTITALNGAGDPVTATVSAIQVDYDNTKLTEDTFNIMMVNYVDDWVSLTGSATFAEGTQTESGLQMILSTLRRI